MTDTTDIAALREVEQFDAEIEVHGGEHFAVWAPALNGQMVKADKYFAVLKVLEAERQRVNESGERFYKAVQYGAKLEAEIAKLKGSLGSVSDWEIYHSTDVPILVYKKCSVIASEQAYGLLNLIKQSELKGDQVPVGWEPCSPEWCDKHNACHEAPRIWFESEDGTGPHYHPSDYKAAQTLLMPDGLHENTKALVIGFANAMAAKLYKSEQKYGWSDAWLQDDWKNKCLTDFNHHISKGDPLDVANYCAFMHYHGWSTSLKGSPGTAEDWEIDHSVGVPILMYKKCSVIESEQAYGLLNLIKQSELKGDQVPVGIVRKVQQGLHVTLYQSIPEGTELFTAPQKPIVLPPLPAAIGEFTEVAMKAVRRLDIAAIEAAGGVVKDGE